MRWSEKGPADGSPTWKADDEEDDRRKIDRAVPEARRKNLTIRMACFSEEEARGLKYYAKNKYPDVSFQFTWLVFFDPSREP